MDPNSNPGLLTLVQWLHSVRFPRTKYQKITSSDLLPSQPALRPEGVCYTGPFWGCRKRRNGLFAEHLLNTNLVSEYKTLNQGKLNQQVTY